MKTSDSIWQEYYIDDSTYNNTYTYGIHVTNQKIIGDWIKLMEKAYQISSPSVFKILGPTDCYFYDPIDKSSFKTILKKKNDIIKQYHSAKDFRYYPKHHLWAHDRHHYLLIIFPENSELKYPDEWLLDNKL